MDVDSHPLEYRVGGLADAGEVVRNVNEELDRSFATRGLKRPWAHPKVDDLWWLRVARAGLGELDRVAEVFQSFAVVVGPISGSVVKHDEGEDVGARDRELR